MGLFGGSKQNIETYQPPKFGGQRPWMPGQVGLGAEGLKPLGEQYRDQLYKMAQGAGPIGLDSDYYDTKKRVGLGDLAEQYKEGGQRLNQQASGQGLRGGVPMSIQRQAQEDYGDQTQRFLDELTIQDSMVRHGDQQRAIYGQGDIINQGAGMQSNRANFDANIWQQEQPVLMGSDDSSGDWLGALAGLGGTLGGAYLGGGMGGLFDGGKNPSAGANKSLGSSGFGQAANMKQSPMFQQRMGF